MCVPAGSMMAAADMWRGFPGRRPMSSSPEPPPPRAIPETLATQHLQTASWRVCVWLLWLSFSICCWRHVIHRGARRERESTGPRESNVFRRLGPG